MMNAKMDLVAVRPGVGHVEYLDGYFFVVPLGYGPEHCVSCGVRTKKVAMRLLREM